MSGADNGITIVMGGQRYFVIGKTRIKIVEHFPADGKTIDELITALVQRETKEKVSKTA